MNINKEVIMKDEKIKASVGADEKLQDALVLRPEWEIKPKSIEAENSFTVSFSEKTRVLFTFPRPPTPWLMKIKTCFTMKEWWKTFHKKSVWKS